jgi:hypothetical protein
MKKKFLAILNSVLVPVMLFADPGSVDAASSESGTKLTLELIVRNFSARLFVLLGGIVAGLTLTIKFAVEMVKTYYSREQNPEAFKSAIIKFALAVFAIFNLSLITYLVFGRSFT